MNTEDMRQHFEADGSPARLDGGTAVVVPSSDWLGSVADDVDAMDTGDYDKTVHPQSCVNCTQCWYYSPEAEESGTAGWVCDGRNGAQNLKSFPFRTKQRCFTPPNHVLTNSHENLRKP